MITWLDSPGRYSNGEDAFLGRWRIGRITWDATTKRSDPNKWRATAALPGIKENLGNFETSEEAKQKLAKAVEVWMAGAGVVLKEPE